MKKQWFKGMPWDRVLLINQTLCADQKKSQKLEELSHEVREPAGDQVRQRWNQTMDRAMTLIEALEFCRRCCDLAPFTFNNANTFANVAKTLLEDWLNLLPSVEGHIARTTIGHYVADHMVSRRELVKVIAYFDARWRINGFEKPIAAEVNQKREIQPQAQPRVAQA